MKIGIIIRFLIATGGGERQALMSARELKKLGHSPIIYTFAYDKERCFPEGMLDINIVPLVEHREDLPKNHTTIPFLGTFLHLFQEAKRAKKLASLIDTDIDVINPQDQSSAWVAYYFKKRKNVPSVLTLNDLHLARWSLFNEQEGARKQFPISYFFHWLRDSFENTTFFSKQQNIAVLNTFTQKMVKKYLGRDSVIIRSGLEAEKFSYKKRKPIERKKINILCHAIFYIHRRFEDVIKAVSLLRQEGYDARLVISGDYSHKDTAKRYYQKLTDLVKELDLTESVSFRGRVSEADLLNQFYQSDIFVFSSHMQTWGLVVFEAMATGLPVVVSKTAGASEVLTDRENALLVEPLNPQHIYQAIKMLADDQELYQKLSTQGALFARDNISWKNYSNHMVGLFEEAIAQSKR